MLNQNFYKLLEINENASQLDIKRAYRQQAQKYHPDVSTEKNTEDKAIVKAYNILKDPKKCQAYDQYIQNLRKNHKIIINKHAIKNPFRMLLD